MRADFFTDTLDEFQERAARAIAVEDRLHLLQDFATRQVRRKRSYHSVRRKRFWVQRGQKCWACYWRRAQVQHHIVQVQHGGETGLDCVIPLCHGCHAVVHPWLRKPNVR